MILRNKYKGIGELLKMKKKIPQMMQDLLLYKKLETSYTEGKNLKTNTKQTIKY